MAVLIALCAGIVVVTIALSYLVNRNTHTITIVKKARNLDSPEAPLFEALYQGDLEELRSLLATRRFDLNSTDGDGETPLIIAIDEREIVELLLSQGADVNSSGGGGFTPLMAAAIDDAKETAALLIDRGASVNAPDSEGQTALHMASSAGSAETAALLIANGADVNAEDKSGNTPLSMAMETAIESGDQSIAAMLRQAGAVGDYAPPEAVKQGFLKEHPFLCRFVLGFGISMLLMIAAYYLFDPYYFSVLHNDLFVLVILAAMVLMILLVFTVQAAVSTMPRANRAMEVISLFLLGFFSPPLLVLLSLVANMR